MLSSHIQNRILPTLLAVSLTLFTACGDGSSSKSSATPTATQQPATATPTEPGATATATIEATRTNPPSNSPTATATGGTTATATNSPTATATRTEGATATPTGTPEATVSPTVTWTATATATMGIPTATATATVKVTDTPVRASTPTATPTVTPTEPTGPFSAHGSVQQLYVVDAVPATELRLLDGDSSVVMTGTADANGTLIFRDVAPGEYLVASGSGDDVQVSGPVTVTGMLDHPDPSIYDDVVIGPEPGEKNWYGYLRTRDGTTLAINVILPGPPEDGPYPTVIEYSGYDPANPTSPQPSTLISTLLGYAAVGINMRGTGCSGGSFQFFEPVQATDGYDAIEVVARQPWVKGHKVGMVGLSYPGISQLFVAQTQPPHLAAIAPLSVISDTGRGTLYPGGILNNGFAVDWAAGRQRDAMPGGQPWSQKRIDAGDQECIDNQRLRGQTPDIFQMIEENDFYDPEVADPLSPVTFVDRINVPVFMAQSWQDEQTGGYAATMVDHFTGTDKAHFTFVNGGHAEPLSPTILSRWIEFLSLYVAEEIPHVTPTTMLVVPGVSSFAFGIDGMSQDPDRFLGVSTYEEALALFESDPRVRILLEQGAGGDPGEPIPGFEITADNLPIPEVEPGIWYFAEGGRLDPNPPSDGGADTYEYDPTRSQLTNCKGGCSDVWEAMPSWNWRQPAAGTALAYVTDPLTEDLVMAGSGSVDLWLESTAPDVDVQVTLSEVRPDGQEVYVISGWLRASHRKLDEAASTILRPVQTHREEDAADLPPGEFAEMRVELFPFAHVFRAGSQVRILVGSPGGDRPLWKFDVSPEDEAINTVGHSMIAPSRVVLPIVPNVDVPTGLPPCPGLRGQPCRPYEKLATRFTVVPCADGNCESFRCGGDVPCTVETTGEWIRIEPQGAVCGNGSQYKFFANLSATSDNVVVYFEPGGACWDFDSCSGRAGIRGAANPNGIPDDHATEWVDLFGISIPVDLALPLLNRDPRVTPTADWNKIFVPYCTGDIHSGNRVITYHDPRGMEPDLEFHHKGHEDVQRVIEWMNQVFPTVPKLLMSGCSAGGTGALSNYYFMRTGVTGVQKGYLLDDSGPIFPTSDPTARSLPLHMQIRDSWDTDSVVRENPEGAPILDDFGNINTLFADQFPNDRLAMTYFQLDYNYSLYSYERFYDSSPEPMVCAEPLSESCMLDKNSPEDRALVYRLWADDTALLMSQYDTRDNLAYFLPFYRNTNDSHCATIPAFEDIDISTIGQAIEILNDNPDALYWTGTDIMTMDGPINLEDYVRDLLDDNVPLQSYFETDCEGRYRACTPVCFDALTCEAAVNG